MADGVSGFERGQVAAIFADSLGGEAFGGGHASGLAVEVAHRAENENALRVDALCGGQKCERLQSAGVFHGGGDELAFSIGEVAEPLGGPGVEELAMPVARGGDFIA